MTSVNVFMNKSKAISYANNLEKSSSVGTQTGTYLFSFVIGKANAIAGGVWGFSSYFDSITKKSEAEYIKKLARSNNGVYLQTIKMDSTQPGGKHIGSWNGSLASAKSISRQGNFSITKIIY